MNTLNDLHDIVKMAELPKFNPGDTIYVVDEYWGDVLPYWVKEVRYVFFMDEDSHLKWRVCYGCKYGFHNDIIEIDLDKPIFATRQEAWDYLAQHGDND